MKLVYSAPEKTVPEETVSKKCEGAEHPKQKSAHSLEQRHPNDSVHDWELEAIVELFQKRFFEAKLQMRQFEVQLEDLIKKEMTKNQSRLREVKEVQELKDLRLQMEALANRQRAWIRKLTETFEAHSKMKAKSKKK
jgi:hypothetical protein